MKWIGISGGIGTGKSTLSRLLREQGYLVCDADQVARQVVGPGTPGLKAVVEKFGPEFLTPGGELNRAKMGEAVFANPERLAELENILHPLVRAEIDRQRQAAQKAGNQIAFYDVPLLFEKKMEDQFDAIILVVSSVDQQIARIKKRDGLAEKQILERVSRQLPLDEKRKKSDFVIENTGSIDDLEKKLEQVLDQLQKY